MDDSLGNNTYGVAYDSKRRFVSYWHQIREVASHSLPASGQGSQRVLEVGIGNGFVSRYLCDKGIDLTTVDIEENLHPDTIANVTALPFPDNAFDVATAYEVLEHMPYEKSLRGIMELRRVSRQWVLISLPDATHAFRFALTIPRVGYIQHVVSVPFLLPRKISYAKSHEWEIGIKQYSLKHIIADMKSTGLQLVKTYRVYENPYHRFFVLKKIR